MKTKRLLLTPLHAVFFVLGVIQYQFTRANSQRSYMAMVNFFCLTGGRFNEWCSRWVSRGHRPLLLSHAQGVLGDMSGPRLEQAVQTLREKGYVTFPAALPADMCERLMQFALTTPAVLRPMDHESKSAPQKKGLVRPDAPETVRYDYPTQTLLANPDVQDLLADHSMFALSERYLDARSKVDVLSMWWHTNFHDQPDSEAAQFYHFDLDRFKWLKVFIYLTDVGPEDGPHSFIEGSHRVGGIPQSFLDRGYVRLTDEEVLAHYGAAREIQFAAPRGTIIVEDTRGLHKGRNVTGNSRLILQLQFSNSLFGTTYPAAKLGEVRTPALSGMIRDNPDAYSAYL